MIILRTKIQFDPNPGQYARRFDKVRSQAHLAGGLYWHSRILQRHFRAGAATRYGYRPRSPKHQEHKRKHGRSPLPLVMMGDTEEAATRSAAGIRGFPSRTTFRLFTPSYIPQRPKRSNAPDMAAEIFAIVPSEIRQIEQVEQRVAEKLLKQMKAPHTVTIG